MSGSIPRVFVPRFMNADNVNAQNLNAKALLSRFTAPINWVAPHSWSSHPDPAVARSPHVTCVRLWPNRLSTAHLRLLYQQRADAIFYPSMLSLDGSALRWRRLTRRAVPVIGTLEGLAGGPDRDAQFSEWAGHPVFCQRVGPRSCEAANRVFEESTHIIAITPFLANMGRRLFGDKFSVLPLGVDTEIFHPRGRVPSDRFRVVAAGNMRPWKRPEFFLRLARCFPQADFVWFGDGPLRAALEAEARAENLVNIRFPGQASPAELAEQFRRADAFVFPSIAEGSPKVAQEAAACGLPLIMYGYYEADSVRHGENGYVVWNDEECIERVQELISRPDEARRMGACSGKMAEAWSWDRVAPRWEERVLECLHNSKG